MIPEAVQLPHEKPYCGAACTYYIGLWIAQTKRAHSIEANASMAKIMQKIKSGGIHEKLGATPHRIGKYLDSKFEDVVEVFYVKEARDNNTHSRLLWHPILGARASHSRILTSLTPIEKDKKLLNKRPGDDYLIIKLMAPMKLHIKQGAGNAIKNYTSAHFVVQVDNNHVMDPDAGAIRVINEFKRESNYADTGHNLYVLRK